MAFDTHPVSKTTFHFIQWLVFQCCCWWNWNKTRAEIVYDLLPSSSTCQIWVDLFLLVIMSFCINYKVNMTKNINEKGCKLFFMMLNQQLFCCFPLSYNYLEEIIIICPLVRPSLLTTGVYGCNWRSFKSQVSSITSIRHNGILDFVPI